MQDLFFLITDTNNFITCLSCPVISFVPHHYSEAITNSNVNVILIYFILISLSSPFPSFIISLFLSLPSFSLALNLCSLSTIVFPSLFLYLFPFSVTVLVFPLLLLGLIRSGIIGIGTNSNRIRMYEGAVMGKTETFVWKSPTYSPYLMGIGGVYRGTIE